MNLNDSYFELFGLAEEFEIDLRSLSDQYKQLQKAIHPDKYASATEQERRISMQQAAQVNTAFQTLKDPLARARYLLGLKGVEFDDEQSTIRDAEFLEQQIELREELEEIGESSDPVATLTGFMMRLENFIKDCVDKLRINFKAGDPAAIESCVMIVHQLQFLYRLRQEAEGLEEEFL